MAEWNDWVVELQLYSKAVSSRMKTTTLVEK